MSQKHELHIHPNPNPQEVDQDVPEYGRFENLVMPPERNVKPDVCGAPDSLKSLVKSAVNRALYAAGMIGNRPPVHFPNAENFQHYGFDAAAWEQYGDMETEDSRIHFMLQEYPNRLFPQEFEPDIETVATSQDVLAAWSSHLPHIRAQANQIYADLQQQMYSSRRRDPYGYQNGHDVAYESRPIVYPVDPQTAEREVKLWQQAVTQIHRGHEQGSLNANETLSMISLYNHIKNPVSPLKSVEQAQAQVFLVLLEQIPRNLSPKQAWAIIAQLCLESSFLALPAVRQGRVEAVGYNGHHELPYIFVDLTTLPRGEYANPQRVPEIIAEFFDDFEHFGEAVMTPITVSYCEHPGEGKPKLFIIDGNNRATAALLMRFFTEVNYDQEKLQNRSELDAFVSHHNLDIEWERDLYLAIQHLSPNLLAKMQANPKLVEEFAQSDVPSLLVQEPNFHTIAVALSSKDSIALLQPMHQDIYNDPAYAQAIASKEQTHGRARDNSRKRSLKRRVKN